MWAVASQHLFPMPVEPSAEVAGWSLTMLAYIRALTKFSPTVWIAEWMGFESRQYFMYFLWLRKVREINLTTTGLLLAGVAALCALIAVVVMKRRDAIA